MLRSITLLAALTVVAGGLSAQAPTRTAARPSGPAGNGRFIDPLLRGRAPQDTVRSAQDLMRLERRALAHKMQICEVAGPDSDRSQVGPGQERWLVPRPLLTDPYRSDSLMNAVYLSHMSRLPDAPVGMSIDLPLRNSDSSYVNYDPNTGGLEIGGRFAIAHSIAGVHPANHSWGDDDEGWSYVLHHPTNRWEGMYFAMHPDSGGLGSSVRLQLTGDGSGYMVVDVRQNLTVERARTYDVAAPSAPLSLRILGRLGPASNPLERSEHHAVGCALPALRMAVDRIELRAGSRLINAYRKYPDPPRRTAPRH